MIRVVKLVVSVIFIGWLISCHAVKEDVPMELQRPNIILIFTDDQGIGDIGYNGNPYIKTPVLDSLAHSGVIFENFYTAPVCSPSRASLMTGKYSIRTGVFDTYNAGAIMDEQEVTWAELFDAEGYKTAVFGKWHLGDHYPFRPSEQGFKYSYIHKSGGVGQPGDPDNYFDKDSSYFNSVLYENNIAIKSAGYCSDAYTDALLQFIDTTDDPFFAYLSFNAPHTPLQLPQKYYDMYDSLRFSDDDDFLKNSMSEKDTEDAKRVYGMLTNIDDNVGRLVEKLSSSGKLDKTILIFLSDNGPQQNRYRMGLRGTKTTVYEGGIKVPAFINYAKFPSQRVSTVLSHMDLLPTFLDYLEMDIPSDMDGTSFQSILQGAESPDIFHTRPLFYHWTRGFPEPYRNIALRQGDFKLVGQGGFDMPVSDFELFNIREDPKESQDISSEHLERVQSLKREFDNWLSKMIDDEDLNFNRYLIGSEAQNTTVLTRNDGRGIPAIWTMNDHFFFWDIGVVSTGNYRLKVMFQEPLEEPGRLLTRLAPYQKTTFIEQAGLQEIIIEDFHLNAGDYTVECGFQGESRIWKFPFTVSFEKM